MTSLKPGFPGKIGVFGAMLLFLPSVGAMGNRMLMNNGQYKNMTKTVARAPEVSLAVDNTESPAVSIQVAGAKQITKHEYERLTRGLAASAKYISCPTIKVTNSANQTVKAFALGIINKQSNSLDILRIRSHPLEPFEEFVVTPGEWAKARKKTTKTFVHDAGVSREDKSLPGWSSEEMWLPGSIDDFYIFVGEVEFSDGTRWFTKRTN